ncbi:Uncharacterised protein [Lysinibacillus capsici]|uniref:Uncharacterized protein n=1 Tax=Lysinibacillus capsici TaxID=2115968 RepID=A0A2X0XP61_9BACI|nr:Uncharacterised protein [Lysinibacillus capsici]
MIKEQLIKSIVIKKYPDEPAFCVYLLDYILSI